MQVLDPCICNFICAITNQRKYEYGGRLSVRPEAFDFDSRSWKLDGHSASKHSIPHSHIDWLLDQCRTWLLPHALIVCAQVQYKSRQPTGLRGEYVMFKICIGYVMFVCLAGFIWKLCSRVEWSWTQWSIHSHSQVLGFRFCGLRVRLKVRRTFHLHFEGLGFQLLRTRKSRWRFIRLAQMVEHNRFCSWKIEIVFEKNYRKLTLFNKKTIDIRK